MQLVTLNERAARLRPAENSTEEIYLLDVKPGQLERALLEPEEILKENGIEVPENTNVLVEFSQMYSAAQVARRRRVGGVVIEGRRYRLTIKLERID